MFQSLLKSIGVADDIRAHLEHVTFHVQRPAWLWLGLALVVPIGWFIFRRQRDNLASVPPSLRLALTATRVLILLMLVLTLAGPYLKLDMKLEKKPIVALVFDQSQSMGLSAGPFENDAALLAAAEAAGLPVTDGKVDAAARSELEHMTRAEFVRKAVERRAGDWLKPLADNYDLRVYSVGKDVRPIPPREGAWVLPDAKQLSPETHLGDGLEQVLDEAAGRQIASIVVFSDGQNTGGRAPAEMAQAARDAGAPVFAVPAGSDTPVQDVAIVDVFAPDSVMIKDTVKIAATVEVQGYLQQAVKVVLLESGKTEPLDAKDLLLRRTEQQRVELSYRAPEEPGAKTLTVKLIPATPLDRDIEANNSDDVLIRVFQEERKLLYVEGMPRWDFRFVKNAVRRDEGLQGLGLKGGIVSGTAAGGATSVPPGQTGSEKRAKLGPDIVLEAEVRRRPANQRNVLPQTVDELARYDTIILGDVSPALVDPAFVKILDEAVRQRGVGLIVEVGPNAMPFLYGEEFLALLPVKLRRKAGLEAQAYKSFKLEISPDGAVHETMRLFDDAGRNRNVWDQMPAFFWCAAVERPAPSATVLAYNSRAEGRYGKLPLIAHHYAGQGKVLFIGTDSTWLWRQFVGDAFFNKFWGQAIRFVARRRDDRKKSWVEVRPFRARPGETAQIELMAFKSDGAARTDPVTTLRVEREGAPAETVEMVADKATLGRYTGKYVPQETGNYRLVYDPGNGADKVEAHLHVRPSTEELRRPNVDRDALAQLGRVKELKDLASIAGEFKGEPKTVSLRKEAPIWDNWLILTVLISIYSLDVGLRRLSGLS